MIRSFQSHNLSWIIQVVNKSTVALLASSHSPTLIETENSSLKSFHISWKHLVHIFIHTPSSSQYLILRASCHIICKIFQEKFYNHTGNYEDWKEQQRDRLTLNCTPLPPVVEGLQRSWSTMYFRKAILMAISIPVDPLSEKYTRSAHPVHKCSHIRNLDY